MHDFKVGDLVFAKLGDNHTVFYKGKIVALTSLKNKVLVRLDDYVYELDVKNIHKRGSWFSTLIDKFLIYSTQEVA